MLAAPKAKARYDADRVDRQQQVEAFLPAQTIAPAHIRQPRQPACTATLGIPGRDAGTVERFIGAMLGAQQLDKMQKKGHQRVVMLPYLAVVLLPRGPCGAARRWRCA